MCLMVIRFIKSCRQVVRLMKIQSLTGLKSVFLVLCILFASQICVAKEYSMQFNASNVKFRNIDTEELAKIGQIWAIAEDHQGYRWFSGARGAARFDGLNVKLFQNEPGNEFTLPEGYIGDILLTKNNRLYFATQSGLYEFDASLERFIKHPTIQYENEITLGIWALAEDSNGHILLGTTGGSLFRYNPSDHNVQQLTPPPGDEVTLNKNIFALALDSQGNIWFGGEFYLGVYDIKTQKIKQFPTGENNLAHGDIIAIAEDRQNRLWIGTSQGLTALDRSSGEFKQYNHDGENSQSISGNNIGDIVVDLDGRLWVSVDGAGLNLYNPKSDSFKRFKANANALGSLKTDSVRRLFVSQAGDLWAGYHPYGVAVSDRYGSSFDVYTYDALDLNSLSSSAISTIYQSSSTDLWLGTGNGINHLDLKTNKISRLVHDPDNANSLSSNGILTVMQDSSGRVWGGTWAGGLNLYEPDKKKYTHFKHDETDPFSIPNNNVWSLKERDKNSLWVGTSAGLSILNIQERTFTPIEGLTNRVGNIVSYKDNYLVLLDDSGFRILEKNTLKLLHKPESWLAIPKAVNVHVDQQDRIWINTVNGFKRLDNLKGDVSDFSQSGKTAQQYFSQIVSDNNGMIWLGNTSGITKFDENSNHFILFNSNHGLPGNSFRSPRASILLSDGRIAMGASEGLVIFDPNTVYTSTLAPKAIFTDLTVLDRAIDVQAEDAPIQSVINTADSMTFNYKQNVFSIKYTALDFQMASLNTFKFRLKGFDPEWREVKDQRTATYTNLNAGRYVFEVVAANDQGIFNPSPSRIDVVVLPPWWKTWWAYTIYVLTVVGIITRFIYNLWRKRRLAEEQNRILERKVAERTADLVEKNRDIQSMLSNMRQGLFTTGVNGGIHPEYSAYLEDIFETSNIAGVDIIEFLFSNAEISSDVIDQISAALGSIVGLDEMNYDFNSHLLINEYETLVNGSNKILSLDWSPIIENDTVEKIMVSVRDVTELKILEKEASSKKRELEIIGQLIKVSANKFDTFAQSAQTYLADCNRLVNETTDYDPVVVAKLYRNMHTIKGNSRTHGLSLLSNEAHETETLFSELKTDKTCWDKQRLNHGLELVEKQLNEYIHVHQDVLGRGQSQNQNQLNLEPDEIVEIQNQLETVKSSAPDLYRSLSKILSKNQYQSVKETLSSVIQSLSSIASDLGKQAPIVVVHDNDILIQNESTGLFVDVFAHILRNSVDHGIESPEERLNKDKPAEGRIEIELKQDKDKAVVLVKDDGRGLNFKRLYEKGSEQGRWSDSQMPTATEVANLIFESEVSTKDVVSNISGRGVGMDAVRGFLVQSGGNIHLSLKGEDASVLELSEMGFVPFEIHIELPLEKFHIIG
ncbi:two component regulator with propeller domain [Alteromonadaceae bacterium 2753L.S.0a.02]|nr:two component regulator with propeller domain [Alteromonadaceae bacterium 2753L.S.0a.02]